MEGWHDRRFFLEPQQTFHRQYEALRAVFVEDQPLEQVAERFGYTTSTLRSMVSRFRAHRRGSVTPPFSSRTGAGDRAGRLRARTGRPLIRPMSRTLVNWTSPLAARSTRASREFSSSCPC
jgi:transposase-like protein